MGAPTIVTGAASGLGAAVARRISLGGTVAIVDRDLGGALAQAEAVREGGGDAHAYYCDVADWDSVQRVIEAVAEAHGAPAALVNAAAVQRFAHTHELDPAEWQRILGVNLTGTFHMSRAVLPYFVAQESGVIVNIASTAGLTGLPYAAAYCAAKGGVIQLTKSLAVEYSQRGVRVNAVAPGGMDTPMVKVPFPEDASVDLRSRVRRSLVGVADPSDVSNVVCFLLSSESRYMTGAVVVADGGALA